MHERGSVDTNIAVMAKVLSLIEFLRLGGSYELGYQFWTQFILSALRVNVDVTWSRGKVLVGISLAAYFVRIMICASIMLHV